MDVGQMQARREIRRHRLHGDANHRAAHVAVETSSVITCFAIVAGMAKPMPMLPPTLRQNLRGDADQLAVGRHQRAAGVAAVDRRIGLQEVLIAAVAALGRPALRAQDAHGHGLADTERVADGEDDVADARAVRIAEGQRRQVVAAFTSSTARSLGTSTPITLAVNSRPSFNSTRTCSAPSTTCALVRMWPSDGTQSPRAESALRGCRSGDGIRPPKNRRKQYDR